MADEVRDIARAARRAGKLLARFPGPERRSILLALADALGRDDERASLLAANEEDLEAARPAVERGELSQALFDRLPLSPSKLDGLCDGLVQLAGQKDLIGVADVRRELDDGLVLTRVACPLGVLGVVFEARPDAVPQITGLALRTGNAVVLKGGREAQRSNAALVNLIRATLRAQGVDPNAVSLLSGREQVDQLLQHDDLIDLVIARGSSAFVRHVQSKTKIEVLGHAEGLCHLFLHASAHPKMSAAVAVDAKCTYPAACNAIETLLWDTGAEEALDLAVAALLDKGVTLRACPTTRARHPGLAEASDADWSAEYGDLTLAIRHVDGVRGAIEHIEAYGSRHTEAILAEDHQAATEFIAQVDAAGVFHNASTRFADGYRYGLGAEVGISTGKLHARGPVGVDGLTTYRWLLSGVGHVADAYGPGKRRFTHKDL